jgi:hypothetical protein
VVNIGNAEAIYARLIAEWEGWQNQDTAPNEAIISDAFNSFSSTQS